MTSSLQTGCNRQYSFYSNLFCNCFIIKKTNMKHTYSWQILVTNPKRILNNLFSILNKYYITIAFCWCRSTIVLENLWSFEYTCSNRWSCDQLFLNKNNIFWKKCSGLKKRMQLPPKNKRDLYGKNSLRQNSPGYWVILIFRLQKPCTRII